MSESREPTWEEWNAILSRAPLELSVHVDVIGTLTLPLHILITDGNDRTVSEFELSRDAAGHVQNTSLFPVQPLMGSSFVFPITYSATDRNGEEWEAVFTEEDANRLLRVI